MTTIQHTVTIDRPVQDVWDYVMDIRNDPVWTTNVVGVGRGAGEPVEVGFDFEETYKFLGRRMPITFIVTEHDPHRRSAVEVAEGPVAGRGSYDFEPVDGGTRFTATLVTDAHGFFKLAEPVFARMARREFATSVEALKDILETDRGS
jgi:uncharacterized protein YndB with AHSA1/START domain